MAIIAGVQSKSIYYCKGSSAKATAMTVLVAARTNGGDDDDEDVDRVSVCSAFITEYKIKQNG